MPKSRPKIKRRSDRPAPRRSDERRSDTRSHRAGGLGPARGGRGSAPARPGSRPLPEPEETLLTWTATLAPKRPLATGLTLTGMVVLAALLQWAFKASLITLLALFLVTASLAQYLFPNTYRLTNLGVHHHNFVTRQFRPWRDFVGYRVFPDAVLLGFDPISLKNRINKGILLHTEANQAPVIGVVSRYLKAAPEAAQRDRTGAARNGTNGDGQTGPKPPEGNGQSEAKPPEGNDPRG